MTRDEVIHWVLFNTAVRTVCGGLDSFAYTAGYWSVGLPEMVVYGLGPQDAAPMLNIYGAYQRERNKPWEPGELDTALYTLPSKIGAVSDAWIAENMALSFERHPPAGPVVQILWPDRVGIFPDEPGYSPEFEQQKVLA